MKDNTDVPGHNAFVGPSILTVKRSKAKVRKNVPSQKMLNQDNINNDLTVTSILMYFAIGLHVRFS